MSRGTIDSSLHARDVCGVEDCVLLEDYQSMKAFVENLRKRFREDYIYTYIGPVLISVNPYRPLKIFTNQIAQLYRNVSMYEVPPHIYAVADVAYRCMFTDKRDQCVLISGESGAGKTEASKKILQYISSCSPHEEDVANVKGRLLQSNPVLEAFGNAKTNRNDNSSRFGKYMDIQFDEKGRPIGGHILNYLLEKSRVVFQIQGERNFHIFYQLLKGADRKLLEKLHLKREAKDFHYLNQGKCVDVQGINDKSDFEDMMRALKVCNFTEEDKFDLFAVISSILHLGNIRFVETKGAASVVNSVPVEVIAKLLGCKERKLTHALLHKTIDAHGDRVSTPLDKDHAIYARDALAKGVYSRTFYWLVEKINSSLADVNFSANETEESISLMGLLDIYGFEILHVNSFEQFCINYCNEKLQQLFITLTLKSEQDEYINEGIEWEPVKFFNNRIILDLIEGRPVGIISILDEECLRPGEANDETFLEKMSNVVGKHPHYMCHKTADYEDRKTIKRHEFRLLHYAGDVTYNTQGFLDKNNDLLFRDTKEVMSQAGNDIVAKCFSGADDLTSKKRPETVASQFRNSLAHLMEILMSKEPSYVRCIKPNDHKRPYTFEERLVQHQVTYLGLLENVRVRRAGFAYRRPYDIFFKRYACLCPETWPDFSGSPNHGVEVLIDYLGYKNDEYKLGETKIFIRWPKTLFATEDMLHAKRSQLAVVIQSRVKGYFQRQKYLKLKWAANVIRGAWKKYVAQTELRRRRKAAKRIQRFIKGFINRRDLSCPETKMFVNQIRVSFIRNLKNELPSSILHHNETWPDCHPYVKQTSRLLQLLHKRNLVRSYCKGMKLNKRRQLDMKLIAHELFKGRKEGYELSIPEPFKSNRLNKKQQTLQKNVFVAQMKPRNERIYYSSAVTKYDRNGYHSSKRVMILTDRSIYILGFSDFRLKEKIALRRLKGVSLSPFSDCMFVLHATPQEHICKGDVILQSDYVIEAVVKIGIASKNLEIIKVAKEKCIVHNIGGGRQGMIEFSRGSKLQIKRGDSGRLHVIAPSKPINTFQAEEDSDDDNDTKQLLSQEKKQIGGNLCNVLKDGSCCVILRSNNLGMDCRS